MTLSTEKLIEDIALTVAIIAAPIAFGIWQGSIAAGVFVVAAFFTWRGFR